MSDGIYQSDLKIVNTVLLFTDGNSNNKFDFQEFMRLHISLVMGKRMEAERGVKFRVHACLFVLADSNYDQHISVSELCHFY